MLKQPTEKDAVYRVTFRPVTNGVIGEKGDIGVKVILAYQVLVLVQPINPNPDLIVKREGNQLKFKNKGVAIIDIRSK